jgi:acetyl esterase/lipase
MRWFGFAPLLALLAGACSPAGVLNAIAPSSGIVERDGEAYGAGARRTLDVYAPAPSSASASARPMVVFFYGGGWEDGDRGLYRFVGASLAAQGFVAVIPDYRVYPEARFPDFMNDAAAAVAWTRDHAAQFGGDADRVFLMGHSAGAQIATLLALDPDYLHAAKVEPRAIAGVIGLAGPYDFLPLKSPTLKAIFGPESQWPRSQPIDFVVPGAPPMLLVTGDDDDTVDPGNTLRLAARLRAAGDPVIEKVYRSVGHKTLIGAMARPLAFLAPVRHDVFGFIAAHSGSRG